MPLTKPFAVATEGPTVDGRIITRQQIEDMAKNYDPAVYTALVNLEHFLSFMPDSSFSAYGKVVSLGTRETDIFGEKRLQLTAVADVSEAAADLQYKGKKGFASIEIMPNFTGRGISYLTGLALTDAPASLGTEPMRFSAFSDPKEGNRYGFAGETEYEIEPPESGHEKLSDTLGDRLFGRVRDLLGLNGKAADARFADHAKAVTAIAESQCDLLDSFGRIEKELQGLAAGLRLNEKAVAARGEELDALRASLDAQPAASARPPATGGSAASLTDC
ncbi:MAG: GPO family capsid scaffolding protein [Azoarcus sp.]|jgi:hypothetical protein|nr:GPO family capsid scaffolding protein [Azoarcus sp.]